MSPDFGSWRKRGKGTKRGWCGYVLEKNKRTRTGSWRVHLMRNYNDMDRRTVAANSAGRVADTGCNVKMCHVGCNSVEAGVKTKTAPLR